MSPQVRFDIFLINNLNILFTNFLSLAVLCAVVLRRGSSFHSAHLPGGEIPPGSASPSPRGKSSRTDYSTWKGSIGSKSTKHFNRLLLFSSYPILSNSQLRRRREDACSADDQTKSELAHLPHGRSGEQESQRDRRRSHHHRSERRLKGM